jgi:hypothetical protein
LSFDEFKEPSFLGWQWSPVVVKLTIELDREVDGRWIAEVPELNILGPAILAKVSKKTGLQREEL